METWKALGPGNVGAAFDKQLAQDRSVASPLVVAIASHRKIGPMRKRGQEIEELSSVRRLHFRPELPLKRGPRFFVVRSFSFFQKLLTGREIGQPNVVKIALGIFRLRHSPGRSANGAEPQTLLSLARRTKLYDGDCHDGSYQGSFAPRTSSTWKSEEVRLMRLNNRSKTHELAGRASPQAGLFSQIEEIFRIWMLSWVVSALRDNKGKSFTQENAAACILFVYGHLR